MESIDNDIEKRLAVSSELNIIENSIYPSAPRRIFNHAVLNNLQFVTSTITFKENRYPFNFKYGYKNWLSDRVKEISDHLSHWNTFCGAICMPEFHKDGAMHFHLIVILLPHGEHIRIRKSLKYFGHCKFDQATFLEAVKYYQYMMKTCIDTAAMLHITDLEPFLLPITSKELSTIIWSP